MLTCNMVWSLTLKPLLIPQHQLHVGPPAPYLTLRTDLQCESQTCGSQSARPPEATYSHCLMTMPSSGFQHSLGGQSPSRKSGVITLFWPQRYLPSLIHHAHDTHTPIPTVQNTYTNVNGECLTSSDLLSWALFARVQVWPEPLPIQSDKPPFQWHSNTVKASLRCSECWVAFNREAHLKSMLFTSKWKVQSD